MSYHYFSLMMQSLLQDFATFIIFLGKVSICITTRWPGTKTIFRDEVRIAYARSDGIKTAIAGEYDTILCIPRFLESNVLLIQSFVEFVDYPHQKTQMLLYEHVFAGDDGNSWYCSASCCCCCLY